MALEYCIEHEQAIIKVTVQGKFDYLSMDQMWKDIWAACKKYNSKSILGIANVEAPTRNDAYDHAGIFDAIGMSRDLRIAWVENNRVATELAKVTEAVIRNRGLATARVFASADEARSWLAKMADTP